MERISDYAVFVCLRGRRGWIVYFLFTHAHTQTHTYIHNLDPVQELLHMSSSL